jgi:hypothetical protein
MEFKSIFESQNGGVMKLRIFFSALFFAVLITSEAQVKTTATRTGIRKNHSSKTSKVVATSPVVTSESSGNYAAKSPSAYRISDPTINALNAKANGADVRISKSGIVGMPKRAYGFANGHLLLSTTSATSSGTITGSGSVGTGSSLGSLGTNGPAMELNGKSPYAGATMWGNARNLWISRGDSAVRVNKTDH